MSPIRKDAPLAPHGSYAVSKTAAERYIIDSGVPFLSLRLANIYGPRNLSGPVPAFYRRLAAGEPCSVVDARRDFVYIDDLLWVLSAFGETEGIRHVASGTDVAIIDVWRAVRDAMGLDVAEPAILPRSPDDVPTILLEPDHPPIGLGVMQDIPTTIEWYRHNGVAETYSHLEVRA